jgi:hypothetical protein
MSDKRPEPFVLALGDLRARLRRGEIPLDTRLAATEIAAELGLSATPIREALSRLAGEGMLEDRRGEGFFVRRLSRADIAALYRLSLAHLVLALEACGGDPPDVPPGGPGWPDGPAERTERLFAAWVGGAGSRVLALSHGRLQAQLAPVRRLESRLFADLTEEGEALSSAPGGPARRTRLRRFHHRRIRVAGRLAEMLEQGPGATRYSGDIV